MDQSTALGNTVNASTALPQWQIILIVVGTILFAVICTISGIALMKRKRAKLNAEINKTSRENFVKDSLRGMNLEEKPSKE